MAAQGCTHALLEAFPSNMRRSDRKASTSSVLPARQFLMAKAGVRYLTALKNLLRDTVGNLMCC